MRVMRSSNPVIGIFVTILLALLAAGCGSSLGPLTLTAPSQTITSSSTLQFTVSGKGSNNVIWQVNGTTGGTSTIGTISAAGLYAAPIAAPSPNSVTVTVQNAKKSSQTAQLQLTIDNRLASITTISPPTAFAGSPDQILTITGADFMDGVTVTADATGLATTFVSDTELSVVLPASLMTASGNISIEASNPAPTVGTDTAVFSIFDTGVVTTTNNPQVARYTITPPVDATVTIEFGLDTDYGFRTWTLPTPGGGGTVEILVAGMVSHSDYHMRAIVEAADGSILLDQDHAFATGGPDPANIPAMIILSDDTLVPAPGVVSLHMAQNTPPAQGLVINRQGEIIWFYESPDLQLSLGFLPTGNLLSFGNNVDTGDRHLQITDLAGDVLASLTVPELRQKLLDVGMDSSAVGSYHHDAIMLPNGNIAIVTRNFKRFGDLIGFEGQDIQVQGDGVVVVNPDLNPVWTWSAFDHLDVNRHPLLFPNARGVYDWTHANGIAYSPADGNLYLSLRNQHWIIKIDYQDSMGTGNILWKLGAEGDFGLLNGDISQWEYAPHHPTILDDTIGAFRLSVFDNGNARPTEPDGIPCEDNLDVDCFSRAVIFQIDEGMRTASIFWEDPLPIFTRGMGSVQFIPELNRVLHDSPLVGVRPDLTTFIEEVTLESPPQMVWKLEMDKVAYRAFVIPSLYPGVQW